MDSSLKKPEELPEFKLFPPQLSDYESDAELEYESDAFFWEKEDREADQILSDYESIDHYIDASVAPEQQYLIQWKRSVHSKLKTLSAHFRPTSYHRARQLHRRWYNNLIRTSWPQDITEWLIEWESFLDEVHGVGEPSLEAKHSSNREAILCFIDAIAPLIPSTLDALQQCRFLKMTALPSVMCSGTMTDAMSASCRKRVLPRCST